jgi:hypothetical protein
MFTGPEINNFAMRVGYATLIILCSVGLATVVYWPWVWLTRRPKK